MTAHDGLGLKAVADHIAFLVRLNRAKVDDSMEGALGRWKPDLDWVHDVFYASSVTDSRGRLSDVAGERRRLGSYVW